MGEVSTIGLDIAKSVYKARWPMRCGFVMPNLASCSSILTALELLKEIAPNVTRAAVLWESALTVGNGQLEAIRAAGLSIKKEVTPVDVRDASELEHAVGEFAH